MLQVRITGLLHLEFIHQTSNKKPHFILLLLFKKNQFSVSATVMFDKIMFITISVVHKDTNKKVPHKALQS